MNVTPLIPDCYNGPIKQLTCRICKHVFYITQDDYLRLPEVRFCHECSLILLEELQNSQGVHHLAPPMAPREQPVVAPPPRAPVQPSPPVRVPQPRTIDRGKMTVEQLLEEAATLRKTWRYKEALSSYEQALQRDADCIPAHRGRCAILRELGRRQEALLAYGELVRLDPQSTKSWVGKGWALVHLKRYEEALAVCEQAIQLAPTKPSVYKEKGDILTKQKRYADALPAYQQVVQLDPEDAFACDQVGDTLSKLERYADAVKMYNQAIRLNPDYTSAYSSKAHALEKLGHYEQALAAYNKALQLSPKHFFLLFARAGVLKKLLRYEEANADYVNAQLVAPDPLFAAGCILASVDISEVAEAKARLEAAGKAISNETIEAEIKLMYKEQKLARLKSSPLFQPICLLMQERQEWGGTARQFKEILCQRSPDAFATWYRSPQKFVEELKEITPALRDEGIAASVPPDTALVTLSKIAMEKLQHPE